MNGAQENPKPPDLKSSKKNERNPKIFFEKILIYANIEDFLKPKLLF